MPNPESRIYLPILLRFHDILTVSLGISS